MAEKVIILDWGIITHKAIFSLKFNPTIPVTYTALNIAISLLYRLDVEPDDLIIVACDGRNSWRKDYESAYKDNRKERRQESGIDWEKCFSQLGKLVDELNNGLNWHFIKVDRMEADDVMAVACRYYKDQQVILATHDKDLEQMWCYPNVRIFSTLTKKWKIRPDDFDLTRLQAEKIYKETTDNMVTPILSDDDYEKRRLCVVLDTLPESVELLIQDELKKIAPKPDDVYSITSKSLQARYANLYNDKSKVISYEGQIAKEKSKDENKAKKKEEAKAKEERLKAKIAAKFQKDQEKLLKRIEKLESKKEKKNVKVPASNTTEQSKSPAQV
jgi:hypothetical protein